MHDVTGPAAGCTDRARDDVGPHIEIVPGVSGHRRQTGRAARRVDADDLLAWYREHAERVVAAQIVFGRERKPGEVLEAMTIVGMDAGRVEPSPVVGDVGVGVAQRSLQALELNTAELIGGRGLDGVEIRAPRRQVAHPRYSARARIRRLWPRNSATTSPVPLRTVTS